MKFYIVIIGLFIFKISKAQDVHFSQYNLSPLTLNPANTGNYKGDYRFFGNYRSQWKELGRAYKTYSAGADFNFFPSNVQSSAGFIIVNDMSGGNLSVTKIMPSLAGHFRIDGYKIHFGMQPGIVIKSIDFYKHTFPNQLNWDRGGFDNTLPNNETAINQNFTYFDLNAGAVISKKYNKLEPEVGFALFHINKPRESFFKSGNNTLPVRQAMHVSLGYQLSNNVILKIQSLYGYTTKASDWVTGLNLEYILNEAPSYTNSVFAGLLWRDGFKRNVDAGIITAGINYRRYTLGLSYDVTLSSLKTAVDYQGAFELAFIYRGVNSRLTKKVISCERY